MSKNRSADQTFSRLDPHEPRLSEIVLLHVHTAADDDFDLLLTRVPGLGEEISREGRSYKIVRVQHEPVDDGGRARFGWHAFIEAEIVPDEIGTRPKRRKHTA